MAHTGKDSSVTNVSFDGFLTTKDDDDNSPGSPSNHHRRQLLGDSQRESTPQLTTRLLSTSEDTDHEYVCIRSQALVDSDNEESTDNEELDIGRAAKFTIGSNDYKSLEQDNTQFSSFVDDAFHSCNPARDHGNSDNNNDNDDYKRIASEPKACHHGTQAASSSTGERPSGGQRFAWQRHSMLRRSHALPSNDDDSTQVTDVAEAAQQHHQPSDDSVMMNSALSGPSIAIVVADAVTLAHEGGDNDEALEASRISSVNREMSRGTAPATADTNNGDTCCAANVSNNINDNNDDTNDEGFEKGRQHREQGEQLQWAGCLVPQQATTAPTQETVPIKIIGEHCGLSYLSLPNASHACSANKTSEQSVPLEHKVIIDTLSPAEKIGSTNGGAGGGSSSVVVEAVSPVVNLSPPPPPPSPVSDSTLDTRYHNDEDGALTSLRLPTIGASGSLSDNSHQHSAKREAMLERRQMQARLRNWKKSNKIITHIRENPFNMHMDCLERLSQNVASSGCTTNGTGGCKANEEENGAFVLAAQDSAQIEPGAQGLGSEQQQQRQSEQQQHQHLQNYATHLSYLYRQNQAIMDNSNDFRTLLYNIICCLLIQDEQVLASPSVSKMIDVIRTHLESTSKFYSAAMLSVAGGPQSVDATDQPTSSSSQYRGHQQSALVPPLGQSFEPRQQQSGVMAASDCGARKSSLGSWSCTSSTCSSGGGGGGGGAFNGLSPTGYSAVPTQACSTVGQKFSSPMLPLNKDCNGLACPHPQHDQLQVEQQTTGSGGDRRQFRADFRRISSVSYNDEQLINDLCDSREAEATDSAGAVDDHLASGRIQVESPWRYEELSSRCRHYSNQNNNGSRSNLHTSQSSLENQPGNNLDQMNDSGIGATMYDYATTATTTADDLAIVKSFRSSSGAVKGTRKRHSVIGVGCESKQQQQQRRSSYAVQSADHQNRHASNLRLHRRDREKDESTASRGVTAYDEESCSLQTHDLNHDNLRPVIDVAGRRAELEWTLNKLINFELKYTWLTSKDTLRRAIRKIGVPNEIRGKIWLILIEQMIGAKYDVSKLLEEAGKTINDEEALSASDEETQSILKQIDLDVNRTMPGHKLFDEGAEGGIKLRRILVAYSIHVNRAIAYCQGFNFIVALLLSVFEGHEEKALRGFVCIVDHIFPSKFYFDHYLTGARADQFLLADFICDQLIKNPTTVERKMVEGVTSSITLNWFISLFHGAVPTLTRLTILDHFMLEGVKALFRFTMAILYLAFQVTPPSSCEVFTTIRNTAKDMYDIKLLLSIVEQIKLPKDSYFAIRRSFYMVQSSFNSDQFYMQSLSNDASRQLVSDKPLSVQQSPDTKPPAMSLITAASLVAGVSGAGDHHHQPGFSNSNNNHHSSTGGGAGHGPRVCTSSDRSKVCIQNIGKLGRSHIKVMDANIRSNERSLMSPLRNSLVIGISNCGKIIVVARQSSRRNFKTFREQDLVFHVYELCTEIFDGFYLEERCQALILTHPGEIFKIDTSKCFADSQAGSTETLLLRDSHSIDENERVKLRLASIDMLTNLLWVYVECEEATTPTTPNSFLATCSSSAAAAVSSISGRDYRRRASGFELRTDHSQRLIAAGHLENHHKGNTTTTTRATKYRSNNPFLADLDESTALQSSQSRSNYQQRKILIIDIITFDIFSAFTVHPSFGDIKKLRTSLVSFCQLANPMSNQFSSRIVRIGATGRYEHLLSLSDVVDFMINLPESCRQKREEEAAEEHLTATGNKKASAAGQRYSSIKQLLARSISLSQNNAGGESSSSTSLSGSNSSGTLTRYYRSLIKSHSTATGVGNNKTDVTEDNLEGSSALEQGATLEQSACEKEKPNHAPAGGVKSTSVSPIPKMLLDQNPCLAIMTSSLSEVEEIMENDYIPVNMTFIFRNGKIALFEFTESYAIHTRESQLDRYDYFKIIEVNKNGDDFIITILTIFDKLIKVVI